MLATRPMGNMERVDAASRRRKRIMWQLKTCLVAATSIETSHVVDRVVLDLESPEEVKGQAQVMVENEYINSLAGLPVAGGITDAHMGAQQNIICQTCFNRSQDGCVGHNGAIELAVPAVLPMLMRRILVILHMVCHCCGAPLYRQIGSEEAIEEKVKAMLANPFQAVAIASVPKFRRNAKCTACKVPMQPTYHNNGDIEISVTWPKETKKMKWPSSLLREFVLETPFTLERALATLNSISPDTWFELGYNRDMCGDHMIVRYLSVMPVTVRRNIMPWKKGGMPHPTSSLMFNIMAPRTNIKFLQRIEQLGGVEEYVRAKYKAAGQKLDTPSMNEEVEKWKQRLKSNASSMEFNTKDMRAAIVHINRVTQKTQAYVRKGRAAAPSQDSVGGSVTAALTGKEGVFRNSALSKTTNCSGRAPVIPMEGLPSDTIVIPESMAVILSRPIIVTDLNKFEMKKRLRVGARRRNGVNFLQMPVAHVAVTQATSASPMQSLADLSLADRNMLADNLLVGTILHCCLTEGDLVIMNREPSLHLPSIMAFKVRIESSPVDLATDYSKGEVEVTMRDAAGEVHTTKGMRFVARDARPLPTGPIQTPMPICTAFNKDYDGDCVQLYVPQDERMRAEAMTLCMPHNYAMNLSTSSPLITPPKYVTAAFWTLATKAGWTLEVEQALQCFMHANVCFGVDLSDCFLGAATVDDKGVPQDSPHGGFIVARCSDGVCVSVSTEGRLNRHHATKGHCAASVIDGYQLLSGLLPRDMYLLTGQVRIRSGRIVPSQSCQMEYGKIWGRGGVGHHMALTHGPQRYLQFVDAMQGVAGCIGPRYIPSGVVEQIATHEFNEASEVMEARIRKMFKEVYRRCRGMTPRERERHMISATQRAESKLLELVDAMLPLDSPLRVLCTAKGSMTNVMRALLATTQASAFDGRRPDCTSEGVQTALSAPWETYSNLDDPEAHGFGFRGLGSTRGDTLGVSGRNLLHMMESGIADMAKATHGTPESGALARTTVQAMGNVVVKCSIGVGRPVTNRSTIINADATERSLNVVQMSYGHNGFDTRRVVHMPVPTLDMTGEELYRALSWSGQTWGAATIRFRNLLTANNPNVVTHAPVPFDVVSEIEKVRVEFSDLAGADVTDKNQDYLFTPLFKAMGVPKGNISDLASKDEFTWDCDAASYVTISMLHVLWHCRIQDVNKRNVKVRWRLNTEQTKVFVQRMRESFLHALVEPGHWAGVIAASAVTEDATQRMLSAFHPGEGAGVESVVRCISAYFKGRSLHVPVVTLPLHDGCTMEQARAVLKDAVSVRLARIQHGAAFVERLPSVTSSLTEAEARGWAMFWSSVSNADVPPKRSVVVMRFNTRSCNAARLSVMQLWKTLQDIVCMLMGRPNADEDDDLPLDTVDTEVPFVVPCIVDGAVFSTLTFIVTCSNWSGLAAGLPEGTVPPTMPPNRVEQSVVQYLAASLAPTNELLLRTGLPHVKDGVVQAQGRNVAGADGKVVRLVRPSLVLYGAKLMDVRRFAIDNIDVCNVHGLTSTDVADMHATFGVEAAQAMWDIAVKNNARPNIAMTHISLLGSIVFFSGNFAPLKPATVKAGAGANFMDSLQDRAMQNIGAVVGLRGVQDDLQGIGAQMMGVATKGRGSCVCDVQTTEEYALKWMQDLKKKMDAEEVVDFAVSSDEEGSDEDELEFGTGSSSGEEQEEDDDSDGSDGSKLVFDNDEKIDFTVNPEEELLSRMNQVGIEKVTVQSPVPHVDPRFFPKKAAAMAYCGDMAPRVKVVGTEDGKTMATQRILEESGANVDYDMQKTLKEVAQMKDNQAENKLLTAIANEIFSKSMSELNTDDVEMAQMKIREMSARRKQRGPPLHNKSMFRLHEAARQSKVHIHISRRTQLLAVPPIAPQSPVPKEVADGTMVPQSLPAVSSPRRHDRAQHKKKKEGDMVNMDELLS